MFRPAILGSGAQLTALLRNVWTNVTRTYGDHCSIALLFQSSDTLLCLQMLAAQILVKFKRRQILHFLTPCEN